MNPDNNQPQQLTVKEALEQGNKLIDVFMGEDAPHANCGRTWTVQYHLSWDWLMPVVEKISKVEFERRYDEDLKKWVIWTHHPVTFGMLDHDGRPMFRFSASTLFTADTLMEAAWLAMVDFIQWYNTQKQ